jgi:hypothetical protein
MLTISFLEKLKRNGSFFTGLNSILNALRRAAHDDCLNHYLSVFSDGNRRSRAQKNQGEVDGILTSCEAAELEFIRRLMGIFNGEIITLTIFQASFLMSVTNLCRWLFLDFLFYFTSKSKHNEHN